jgi:DNA polymerase elongation subunit (family B)
VFRPAADGFDSPELESVERLFPALKLKTVSRETEPELIQAFFNVVSSEDVDVFVALEGLSNLMPFLAKRLLFLKVDLPNCSRITGPRPRLSHVQRESIHGGDQNYDWLDIPGRCQVDLMDTARDLKLTVANPFTVLASLLRDEHKFEPGWSLMRDLYAEEYVGVRLCDLPCLQAQRLDHQVEQESIWTALFCWLAEEDKRLLLEMKQVSSISNTPLMALIFQGDFRRVLNLLYLNSFPEHQPGQPPTESRILFSHQVELLRQNWPAALDPDDQAEKKAQVKQQSSGDPDDEDDEQQNESHPQKDPDRGPQPSRRKKTVIRVKGGNVIEPIPGFDAGPLFIFDFKGLYPTIIRSDCGDLAIMVRTRAEAMFVIQYFKLKVVHQNSVVIDKLNRALFFVQDPAFPMNDKVIISSCEKLTIRREQLKTNVKQAEQDGDVHRKDLYKAQELATKKMNNGVYGVMKIIYPAFAGAITGEGRDCQEKMFQFMGGLDAEFEYEPTGVIAYGDTDSVFVKPRLLSPSLRQKIGVHDEETGVWQRHDTLEDPDTQLFDLICQSKTVRDAYFEFAAHLCKRFTSLCRPPIELECDGLMGNFLILKKKNYVGLNFKSRHDVKPKLKVQGVPSVRRDRAGITRKTFAQMSEQLCVHKNYEAVLSVFSDAIRSIKKRTVLFADLFITREITAKARKATNNITSHVCKELQQKTGKVLQDSDRLMYVAYVRDSKAKSVQFRHFSLAAQCQPDEINRTFYVDELVTVATSAFQTVFGEGVFANIAYEQTTLPGQLCKATAAPTKPKKKAKRKADRSNNQQTNRLVDAMFGKRQKADI